jgi:AraC-like DNA-binding protein
MAARRAKAAARLAEGTTPISTIALDLGFASSQHFSAAFRDAKGMTPTQYREPRKR